MDDKRERYLDVLRAIAMILVVLNHCWGYFSVDKFHIYNGLPLYYTDALLNSITRCDVPIFLMISGYLMLSSKKYTDLKNCLRKARGGTACL